MEDNDTEEATTFDPTDAPLKERLDGVESKRDQFKRLKDKNTLRWNGKWHDSKREAKYDRQAIVDSVAGHLSLTDYQHAEAQRIFDELPANYNRAYATSKLAFAVCAFVAWKDGRDYHPSADHPDHFEQARQDYNIDDRVFQSIWARVYTEVEG
jgi:hypothetical protein